MDYSYEPLPPINEVGQTPSFTRLMLLAPGIGDHPLECSLIVIDPANSPLQYEALSYVWGTERAPTPIRCGNGIIGITLNLERALKDLRVPHQTRPLWVDALCTNQKDLDERARQVAYMRQVYKHARRVVVWLGPLDGIRSRAIMRAQELCAFRAMLMETTFPDSNHVGESPSVTPEIEVILLDALNAESEHASAEALMQLFESDYFKRVWCIQEVVASRSAIAKSGDMEMDFYELLSIIKLILTKQIVDRRGPAFPPNTLQFWVTVLIQRDRSYYPNALKVENSLGKMLNVLMGIRDFQSTDPRDRLFAILGITDEGLQPVLANMEVMGRPNAKRLGMMHKAVAWVADKANSSRPGIDFGRNPALKPCYTKPAMEIYRNFTRYMVRKQPRLLDILSHVQHTKDPNGEPYPSWVPKFDTPRSVSYFPQQLYLAGVPYTGHYRYFAELHDCPLRGEAVEPNVLQLDGFIFDQVVAVTAPTNYTLHDDTPVENMWSQLFGVPLFPRSGLRYADGKEQADAAFFATLSAGAFGPALNLSDQIRKAGLEHERLESIEYLTQLGRNNIVRWLFQSRGYPVSTYQDLLPSGVSNFEQAMGDADSYHRGSWSMLLNRRLYRTRAGWLGLGPNAMRDGDILVVLYGGSLPFVLRPTGDDWLYIGDTYVHNSDLMNGHLVDRVRRGQRSHHPMTFRLV
ncbi:HET domain protein [Truncatella angustata]|uniref:HET domain protein n=1 Tax=Truncatella angustata TaxID=152316 RepID=A0A9P8UF75_9PEZI|nr:HET domain protein [Truncatella angustata]KAH6648824.1 HET domain protein [Truncatella angustata]